MPRLLVWMLLGVLPGCATLSENECRSADWYEIGERDGSAGHSRSRVEEHAEACRKLGIIPDRSAYYSGREQGLYRYCTPENGYELGRTGRSYGHVCVGERESRFLVQYRRGKQLYDLEQEIRHEHREIERLEQQLQKAAGDGERSTLRRQIAERDRQLILLRRRLGLLDSM